VGGHVKTSKGAPRGKTEFLGLLRSADMRGGGVCLYRGKKKEAGCGLGGNVMRRNLGRRHKRNVKRLNVSTTFSGKYTNERIKF